MDVSVSVVLTLCFSPFSKTKTESRKRKRGLLLTQKKWNQKVYLPSPEKRVLSHDTSQVQSMEGSKNLCSSDKMESKRMELNIKDNNDR